MTWALRAFVKFQGVLPPQPRMRGPPFPRLLGFPQKPVSRNAGVEAQEPPFLIPSPPPSPPALLFENLLSIPSLFQSSCPH